MRTNKPLHLLLFLLFSITISAQTHTISGYMEDAATGEKLIGATVIDLISGDGTVTNTYGFFSLTMPAGNVELALTYIGFPNNTGGEDLDVLIARCGPNDSERSLWGVEIGKRISRFLGAVIRKGQLRLYNESVTPRDHYYARPDCC